MVNNILCIIVGLFLILVGSFMLAVYGTGRYNPYTMEIGFCLIVGICAVMFKGKAVYDALHQSDSNAANS